MSTKAIANLRLKFASQRQISALICALTPEANVLVTRRANVKLDRDGLFLVLTVEAEDTVALRAMLNAYLRWIGSIIKIIDILE